MSLLRPLFVCILTVLPSLGATFGTVVPHTLPVAEADKPPYTFALASDPSLPGKGTSAYRYSLQDAETKGVHETTNRNPHRIIRGRIHSDNQSKGQAAGPEFRSKSRSAGVARNWRDVFPKNHRRATL